MIRVVARIVTGFAGTRGGKTDRDLRAEETARVLGDMARVVPEARLHWLDFISEQ